MRSRIRRTPLPREPDAASPPPGTLAWRRGPPPGRPGVAPGRAAVPHPVGRALRPVALRSANAARPNGVERSERSRSESAADLGGRVPAPQAGRDGFEAAGDKPRPTCGRSGQVDLALVTDDQAVACRAIVGAADLDIPAQDGPGQAADTLNAALLHDDGVLDLAAGYRAAVVDRRMRANHRVLDDRSLADDGGAAN